MIEDYDILLKMNIENVSRRNLSYIIFWVENEWFLSKE